MSLILEVSPEIENRLRAAASRAGVDVSRYLVEIALEKVQEDEAAKDLARCEWGAVVVENQKNGLYD